MMKIKYSSGLEEKTYRTIDHIAREWLAIGRQLGLDEVFLNSLSGHGDITAARNMIDHWLHTDKNATWTRLIAAIVISMELYLELCICNIDISAEC